MKKNYTVAIVGGGSAGLFTALKLTENFVDGPQVVILERNDRVGKKLLTSGNGQGNLTNKNLSCENYYGDKSFIRTFFNNAKEISIEQELKNLGIYLTYDENGRAYPVSKQANSVLDIFIAHLNNRGVNIKTNFFVKSVDKTNDGFTIKSDTDEITAKYVVCAFGGASGTGFGTDGKSYAILQNAGHTLTPIYPSLVQVKTSLEKIKSLKGIKEQVLVKAFDGDNELKREKGELLFTEYGVSGPSIFQISGHLAKAKNPKLEIEFLPCLTESELKEILSGKFEKIGFIDKREILNGLLSKRLGQVIMDRVKTFDVNKIIYEIKHFVLEVKGNTGFNNSQVTKGGINTDKINPITMESKLLRRVYCVGELLDVDGDCGGYNLTFAFLSGAIASKSIIEKIRGEE